MDDDRRADAQLAELTASLAVLSSNARASFGTTLSKSLAELFRGPVNTHRVIPAAVGWEVETYAGIDAHDDFGPRSMARLLSLYSTFLRRAPTQWTEYDPLRPEASQRNRVLGPAAIRRFQERDPGTRSAVVRDVYEPMGLTRLPHMRVVLCDGPFLLAWLGVWRKEPIGRRDVRRLARLVGPLRRRLRVDRMLDGAMTSETVAVALDAIAAPAFLVRRAGGIEFANEAGRLLFERRGPSLARSVHTAVVARGRTEGVSVTPLQSDGAWSRAIVVLHGENASAEARLAVATVRWKLTPRQREVVALLARGDSNKDIAAKLRCTPRTAEVHVAAVLTKARVETRGQLIARFWNQV